MVNKVAGVPRPFGKDWRLVMFRHHLVVGVVSLTVLGMIGCQSPSRRRIASAEPALITSDPSANVTVVDPSAPVQTSSVIDRHPLLNRPKQYYDTTKSNKLVKTAAATFVGVPAGLFGELKQIVVGVPSAQSPATY